MLKRRLVFFDVDDTLVNGQTQKILGKYLYKNGKVSIAFVIKILFYFLMWRIGIVKNVVPIRKECFLYPHGTGFIIAIFFLASINNSNDGGFLVSRMIRPRERFATRPGRLIKKTEPLSFSLKTRNLPTPAFSSSHLNSVPIS